MSKNNSPASNFPNSQNAFLTEFDLYLLGEGNHWKSYEKLGAHFREVDGVLGVNFAVWAPNATAVSVIGEFNNWNGNANPMFKHIPTGFWEVFIPGVKEWATYKYLVRNGDIVFEKSDPVGFYAETPPYTASKVVNLDRFQWNDADWLEKRRNHNN
ncbi:MAG: hypothetical protein LBC02_07535, partial [Planctomycetaceae bacterium]|nr:hypothetical protein [Planctomycetaceae bacterium]